MPRPRIRHARAASRLGARLGPPFDEGIGGPGGWILLDEPELHFGEDVLGLSRPYHSSSLCSGPREVAALVRDSTRASARGGSLGRHVGCVVGGKAA